MKKRMGFGSIKSKLIFYITCLMLVMCIGLGLISYYFASSTLSDTVNDSMMKIATQGALSVEQRLDAYYGELRGLAEYKIFQDRDTNRPEINELFNRLMPQWDYLTLYTAEPSGMNSYGFDITTRDYYQKAMAGNNAISDPVISYNDGTLQCFLAVPIKDLDGKIIGMLGGSKDGMFYTQLAADVTFGKTGYSFIINSKGDVIAHNDKEMVMNAYNIFTEEQSDASLTGLADLERKMVAGESGSGEYLYQGEEKFLAFCPIGDTGWSMGLSTTKSEVFSGVNRLAYIIVVTSAVLLVIGIIVGIVFARNIATPIVTASNAVNLLASKDYTYEVNQKNLLRKDELGILAAAIKKIVDSMNETMQSIRLAAEQVFSGAEQVSATSMALSQGATEQASSVEELSASIEQIAAQTRQNADYAMHANDLVEKTKSNADNGNTRMSEMILAMDDINKSSNDISKIIKVIDEIAFQTNILALNAAVEAARAGQHGKGFAVVAEEVRTLAARSANAAKETTSMIENSIKNVEDGMKIANETSDALKLIVEEVDEVAGLVNKIAIASKEQAAGIEQINSGISQVSSVVQSNSAISEESASSSEQLSSQAEVLKAQVNEFKLK